jgi:hypothetical protein
MSSIYDKSSLVLIPSGTKTSKVYSQKPTNGDGDFTFSRSTAATRVNASGNIEKETQNLLLQSNSFNTTWTNSGTAETGGQSGYDGSNDAWLITKSASDGYIYQYISQSGVQCVSVYAKANALGGIQIYVNAGTTRYQSFNLTNGTLIGSGNGIDAKIESVGNGWYRCSMSFNDTITRVRFYPMTDAGDKTTTSGSIYIQDAQLEQGLVARDYIETTTTAIYGGITDNVPRLDYTDSSCPALLLEPQRTNLYQHSEYIFNFQGTETFNAAVSPEGVSNAVLLTKTSASDQFVNMSWSGSSLSASTDYTMSLFVKHNGDDVDVRYEYNNSNDWGKGWNALFQVRASGVTASTTNLCTSDVEDYGNGWYRILVFVETASSITPSSPSNLLRVIGASGDDVLVYGAGMEQGSYATSYIPTYGSAVTRNLDTCLDAGDNEVINSTQGTIYGEQKSLEASFSYNYFATISDGTNNNRLEIRQSGTSLQFLYRIGGAYQNNIALNSAPFSSALKYALRYSSTDIKLYVNGSLVGTINSPTLYNSGTLNNLQFAEGSGGNNFRGLVHNCMYFPTALTDQEMIDLTTI